MQRPERLEEAGDHLPVAFVIHVGEWEERARVGMDQNEDEVLRLSSVDSGFDPAPGPGDAIRLAEKVLIIATNRHSADDLARRYVVDNGSVFGAISASQSVCVASWIPSSWVIRRWPAQPAS